jgi:hypothetical protein
MLEEALPGAQPRERNRRSFERTDRLRPRGKKPLGYQGVVGRDAVPVDLRQRVDGITDLDVRDIGCDRGNAAGELVRRGWPEAGRPAIRARRA